MNNVLKAFLIIGALGIFLAGCGTSADTSTEKGEKTGQNGSQDKSAARLASSIELTHFFEHSVEKVNAELLFGQSDYYMYLPKTVEFEEAKDGKDIITTLEIPTSTMTIEVIEKSNIKEAYQTSKEELSSEYPDQQVVEDLDGSFTGKLLFQASSENKETSKTVYFIEIEEKVFKITEHIWASETAEKVRFAAMINTIGTISEDTPK